MEELTAPNTPPKPTSLIVQNNNLFDDNKRKNIIEENIKASSVTEAIEELVNNDLKTQLLEQLRTQLAQHEINLDTNTAVKCIRFSMEVVEMSELKGNAQKDMAIRLVKSLLDDAPLNDSKKIIIQSLLDEDILGDTIDLIVDATKGNLNINQLQEVAKKCCFPFFTSLLNK